MSPRVRVTVEYLDPIAPGMGLTPTVIELDSIEISSTRRVSRVVGQDGDRLEADPETTWTLKGVKTEE